MKSTGIVRRLDELGRLVIPIALRRNLKIEEKDGLGIFIDNDRIILRKFQPTCVFCGDDNKVIKFKGKTICTECLSTMGRKDKEVFQGFSAGGPNDRQG